MVIGGSKFIGWRFVELLGQTNHNVTVVNRGNNIRDYPANVTHYVSDRHDFEKMRAIIASNHYDAVFDMCAFVGADMQYSSSLFGGKTDKYVFISTAATYLEPHEMPILDDYAQGIHSVWGGYGGGKLECEEILLSAYEHQKFPMVIVRPSYVYGIGNTIDRETLIFDRITKNRKILVPGCGEAVIQLGEVTDLCKALLKIAEGSKGYGECYNISGNECVTLNGLVRMIAEILGKPYHTVLINPKDYGMTDRDVFPFENVSYFTDCQKFSKDFAWKPLVSLKDGLTVAYEAWLNSSVRISTNYHNEDLVLAKIAN